MVWRAEMCLGSALKAWCVTPMHAGGYVRRGLLSCSLACDECYQPAESPDD
jgi:hypothetical protein